MLRKTLLGTLLVLVATACTQSPAPTSETTAIPEKASFGWVSCLSLSKGQPVETRCFGVEKGDGDVAGSTANTWVNLLQTYLSAASLRLSDPYLKVTIDGKFGDQTRSAVLRYQRKMGFPPALIDGKVGTCTWSKLQTLEKYAPMHCY